MTDVVLRPPRRDERSRLREILAASNRFLQQDLDWAMQLVDSALNESGPAGLTVAERDGVVIGWIGWQGVRDIADTVEICWLAVHPSAQRQRVGSMLLHNCETQAERSGARWVLIETAAEESSGARAFYEMHGYQEISRIMDFERKADDRLVMIRRLQH